MPESASTPGSARSAGPWLRVEVKGDAREARPGQASAPLATDADATLRVKAGGLPPDSAVELHLGAWSQRIRADQAGEVYWADRGWLRAVAGEVTVRLGELALTLEVRPTKLTARQLRAIIAELEALAAGLSADLGGHGAHAAGQPTAEAALVRLERIAGSVAEATAWIRRHPLSHARVSRRPVPGGPAGAVSPSDVRWLARSPAALRAAAGGRPVTVAKTATVDLDRPENRGVVGLLDRLDRLVADVQASLAAEHQRIEDTRAARTRFRTAQSNLYDEIDRPRLARLDERAARLAALRDEFTLSRARSGLTPHVRPSAVLPRTAAVEAHPGYWNLRRVWEELQGIGGVAAHPTLLPMANLDVLYETWAVVQVARALAAHFGEAPGVPLRLSEDGWFGQLPRGSVGHYGDGAVELLYEPAVGGARAGEFCRLVGGAPLRPDLILVHRRPRQAPALHVFDVKHQRGAGPRGVPEEALREVWWKYGEAFGDPETRAPLVASVWIIYPGAGMSTTFVAPGMAGAGWPAARLRGGAVPLAPGHTGELADVLGLLFAG